MLGILRWYIKVIHSFVSYFYLLFIVCDVKQTEINLNPNKFV